MHAFCYMVQYINMFHQFRPKNPSPRSRTVLDQKSDQCMHYVTWYVTCYMQTQFTLLLRCHEHVPPIDESILYKLHIAQTFTVTCRWPAIMHAFCDHACDMLQVSSVAATFTCMCPWTLVISDFNFIHPDFHIQYHVNMVTLGLVSFLKCPLN